MAILLFPKQATRISTLVAYISFLISKYARIDSGILEKYPRHAFRESAKDERMFPVKGEQERTGQTRELCSPVESSQSV